MGKLDKDITTQEELDAIISARVKDEKDLRQRVTDLEGQLQAAQDQLKAAEKAQATAADEVRGQWYRREQERAALDLLASQGHTDEGKNKRILRHLDYDAITPDQNDESGLTPDHVELRSALTAVGKDIPELFSEGGSGDFSHLRGPDASRGQRTASFLTRDMIENMSHEELIARQDDVDAFLERQG